MQKLNIQPIKSIVFLLSGILLLGLLSSCSGNQTITDTIAEHGEEAILKSKKIDQHKTYPEASDLLNNSAVVFSIFMDEKINPEFAGTLHLKIGQQLKENGLFTKMLNDKELNSLLEKNPRLAQAKDIYLDSLTLVSVSDKDISNPLGKYLDVKDLLVFQLDHWPCLNCGKETTLRMKLKLVDAESSYIIWTGIAEKKNFDQEELGQLDSIALSLVDQLTEQFYNRFKKKWHRKRYEHLAELSG